MAASALISRSGVRLGGRHARRLLALAAVGVVAFLGLVALHGAIREVRIADLRDALSATAPARVAAAILFTFVSYAALSIGEQLALRAIGRPLPWRIGALGAFTGYAVSYNLGLPLLTGGSSRYRVYHAAGLDVGDVARVAALGAASFWSAVALLALMVGGRLPWPHAPALALWQVRAIGMLMAGLGMTLPLLRLSGCRAVTLGTWRLPLPNARQQVALGMTSLLDLLTAALALFVLLPQATGAGFLPFFLVYALAIAIALVSHVPGGLGVFETAVLAATPGDRTATFAALLLYRLIYYLLPLLLAALLIVWGEARRLRRPLGIGLRLTDRVGQALAPSAVTLLVFGSGLVLLVSGALPGLRPRLGAMDGLVPSPSSSSRISAAAWSARRCCWSRRRSMRGCAAASSRRDRCCSRVRCSRWARGWTGKRRWSSSPRSSSFTTPGLPSTARVVWSPNRSAPAGSRRRRPRSASASGPGSSLTSMSAIRTSCGGNSRCMATPRASCAPASPRRCSSPARSAGAS